MHLTLTASVQNFLSSHVSIPLLLTAYFHPSSSWLPGNQDLTSQTLNLGISPKSSNPNSGRVGKSELVWAKKWILVCENTFFLLCRTAAVLASLIRACNPAAGAGVQKQSLEVTGEGPCNWQAQAELLLVHAGETSQSSTDSLQLK